MSQSPTGPDPKRRKAVRRHRRERQIVVFGVIIIAVAAIGFMASAIYSGDVEGPFASDFSSPAPELGEIDLVCPPPESKPLEPSQVVVRVNNSTDAPGLASTTRDTLAGRGFVVVGATNWSREYDGNVEIYFGAEGVQHAYTLARQFTDAELVLDSRPDITVDLVLGVQFSESPQLREPLAPELSPDLNLTAGGECRPANLVVAVPAPRTLPENPLASASPSPSPEPEAEGDEG
ncbi:LytR C-terminal domain-containing protein [Demequina sp. NBRC 110053]|uniref:LytR C-terminal domain-containing protein n=1 Tax=Demequina sp. NBRC 110053 TaxID=1570342 RepID=UPI000A0758ED|nr:LytR C-terminal domain-containing protein [Demequina sp. NBRC 110053]